MKLHEQQIKILFIGLLFIYFNSSSQNVDPLKAQIITSDINNFWKAFEMSKPDFKPKPFDEIYLSHGSKGVRGFTRGRIQNAEHLASVVKSYQKYYGSIKLTKDSIPNLELVLDQEIKGSFIKLKEIYPQAIFPPIYIVVGALNSAGTTSKKGIIIGSEMFGISPQTDLSEINKNVRLKAVLKRVSDKPHVVAHELIHIQQHGNILSYLTYNLLELSIREGSADFLGEMFSGKHVNQHVHDFANPMEEKLWREFQTKMYGKSFKGWLYSSSEGRPNDLGYWVGYKITKAFYDQSVDKKKAIYEILNVKNYNEFLKRSGYANKFN